MLPIIPKPGISPRQKAIALGVAGFVDLLQIAVLPAAMFPLTTGAIDIVTVLVLLAICGFKWPFVAGFILELIPGLALVPTWTALALMLPTRSEEGVTPPAMHRERGSAPQQRVQVEARVVPPVQPRQQTTPR